MQNDNACRSGMQCVVCSHESGHISFELGGGGAHARNAITMHKYSACLPNLNFAANCLQKRLC
eukprot:1304168-Pleurochrysis_carterae.AAC.1